MAAKGHDLVIAVFDDRTQAERAVEELWRAGFSQDRIDVVTRHQGVTKATDRLDIKKDAGDGALTGAVAGASAGAVAGAVAAMLIPGLGLVIGGGLLAGVLGGAALGAAGGTFLGPFVALQMSEEEARHYSGEVEAGRTVLLVQTSDRAEEARSILRKHGGRERQEGPATTSGL